MSAENVRLFRGNGDSCDPIHQCKLSNTGTFKSALSRPVKQIDVAEGRGYNHSGKFATVAIQGIHRADTAQNERKLSLIRYQFRNLRGINAAIVGRPEIQQETRAGDDPNDYTVFPVI